MAQGGFIGSPVGGSWADRTPMRSASRRARRSVVTTSIPERPVRRLRTSAMAAFHCGSA